MTKLCLISGWSNSVNSLKELTTLLSDHFEVHAKSPNQLAAPAQHGDELSGYAQNAADWIGSLDAPVILAGWSMGGLIATELAAQGKLPLSALALLSTSPKFCKTRDYAHGSPVAELRAFAMGVRHAPDLTLTRFFNMVAKPEKDDRETIGRLVKEAREMGAAYLQDGLQYLLKSDLRESLQHIETPTLIVHGTKDNVIPFSASEYTHQHLRGSTHEVVEGKGHDIPTRYPNEVADRITAFAQSLA